MANAKGDILSLRPSDFTPALGRVVAPSAWRFNVQAKAWTYLRSNRNRNGNSVYGVSF